MLDGSAGGPWRRFQVAAVVAHAGYKSCHHGLRIGVVEPRVYMRMVDAWHAAVATSLVLVSAGERDHLACGDVRRMGWMTTFPDVLDRLRSIEVTWLVAGKLEADSL